jgi:hypothetical protein
MYPKTQYGGFLENGWNNFHEISVIYGDHILKQHHMLVSSEK